MDMDNQIIKTRKRPSKDFFITIPKCDLYKEYIYYSLDDFTDQLAVSRETHCDGTYHLHIYARFNGPLFLDEVQNILNVFLKPEDGCINYGYDLQVCKSRRNVLKYITKEDAEPMYKGIDINDFSFYLRALKWIDSKETFEFDDPFVAAHPQYYRYLEEMFTSRKSKTIVTALDIFGGLQDQKTEWARLVQQWWNDWLISGWHHKKKQLYLHGPSNTGKSQLVQALMGDGIHVYQPSPNSNFAWEDFNKDLHRCVLMNEFDPKCFNMSEWKQIVEGSTTKVNVKGKKGKYIKVQCPIVMISNMNVPDIIGFRERCEIIFANENNY